jgi:putative phosphonate metabolism protein
MIGRGGRVALYYAPATDDPLHEAASVWLGRDAATGAGCAQPDLAGIAEVTAEAAQYGFHATLKPPMRLADGAVWQDVLAAARAVAATVPAFDLPRLAVSEIHGFLALRETEPSPRLQALADTCVAGADHLRAPPSADELARRRHKTLPPAADANLVRWGYPYVFATWFFHMTLTRRLTADELPAWRAATAAHVAEAVARPRRVADLCLFVQPAPGAPFTIAERIPLRG